MKTIKILFKLTEAVRSNACHVDDDSLKAKLFAFPLGDLCKSHTEP